MKRNSRLSLALHALGHMAAEPDRMRTSADIAAHAGTNPVVVRRVLGSLREAGLLVSEGGHSGGWRLARSPKEITLADIYLALDERLVPAEADDTPQDCQLAHALHDRVARAMVEAERSLVEKLAETTIFELRELAEHHHR
jgi:Rrf2 family protein